MLYRVENWSYDEETQEYTQELSAESLDAPSDQEAIRTFEKTDWRQPNDGKQYHILFAGDNKIVAEKFSDDSSE